jgi:predicted nucleic acid-binding protein
MGYILDADWVINALAGKQRADTLLQKLAPTGITISWITVGEIYDTAFAYANPDAHLAAFRQFLSPYQVVGVHDPIMERFAEIRSFLRRRGQLISDFDILLGATALHYDLTVLTFNRKHFARIPDLVLYQPD